MARMTEAQREAHNGRRRVTPQPTKCEVCGEAFAPKRSDAKTCSARCRQQLSRAARRDRGRPRENRVREQNTTMRANAEAEVATGSTCPVAPLTAATTDEGFAEQDEAFVRANLGPWRAAGVSEREIEKVFANCEPGVRAAYYRLR